MTPLPMIPLTTEGDALEASILASGDDESTRLAYAAWCARMGCHGQARAIAGERGERTAAMCRAQGLTVRVVLDLAVGAVPDAEARFEHFRALLSLLRDQANRVAVFLALLDEVLDEAVGAALSTAELTQRAVAELNKPALERAAALTDLIQAGERLGASLRRMNDAARAYRRPAFI